MLIVIVSRSVLKLGHGGSKAWSLGQVLEKPCVHLRGHRFDHKFIKLCQNVNIIISRSNSKLGHVGSKTRSLGQILEKPCVYSRGHSFDSKLMKLNQNAIDHNI